MKSINLVLVALIMIFSASFLSAQTTDPKYYIDYQNDFEGYAVAIYLTEDQSEMVPEILNDLGDRVPKLTKKNMWLCEQALNEWDTEPGESYLVFCFDNHFSESGIVMYATIQEDGESHDWWAKVMMIEDFNSL